MVSVCLPSDALLQHLLSYLGFSYLGLAVTLHGCSIKAQPLLLTLDEGCLLTTAPPDLEHGVAPLGTPAPAQPPFLGRGVAPPGHRSLLWTQGSSSQPFMHRHCLALSAAAPGLPIFNRNMAYLDRMSPLFSLYQRDTKMYKFERPGQLYLPTR